MKCNIIQIFKKRFGGKRPHLLEPETSVAEHELQYMNNKSYIGKLGVISF